MPSTFNKTLYRAERMLLRIREKVSEQIEDMVKTYPLESLYPSVEVEVNGRYTHVREILPHQRLVHQKISLCGKTPSYILVNGGVGSGKSVGTTVDIIDVMLRYPGIKVVCVTGYDYLIDESIWPNWEKVMLFEDSRIESLNRKARILKFRNGSEIRFKAYDDADKIRGWDAHVIWIEEGGTLGDGNSHKAKAIWQALLQRHRAQGRYPRFIIVSQNPKGHNWSWKIFIEKSPQRRNPVVHWIRRPEECKQGQFPAFYKEYEYVSDSGTVFYCVSSNTGANTKNPKEYEANMYSQMTQAEIKRMVDGDFDAANELAFDAPFFSRYTHVVPLLNVMAYYEFDRADEFRFPRHWPVICGIDVGGTRSPWALIWFVIDPDTQTLFCFKERYINAQAQTQVWDDIVDILKEEEENWDHVDYYIDPKSGPMHTGPNLTSIIEEFSDVGIDAQIPKGYGKHGGILHARRFLKPDLTYPCPFLDDREPDDDGKYSIGRAKLYFIQGACEKLLQEMETWRYAPLPMREAREWEEGLSPVVSEKLLDRDDHGPTAMLFALIGYSPLPKHRTARKRDKEDHDYQQGHSKYPARTRHR